jgi:O-antigen/teichoic acid export membrane protein
MVSGTLVLSASTALLKLLFGFLQMENGLLLGFIAAQVITAIFITFRISGSSHKPALVTGRDMYITAGMYTGFPKYNMINALLNTFSSNMPVYAFALYFAHDTIGQFSVALALLFTPVNTYNNSVNQVLYKRIIEIKNADQQVWPFIKKYISRTLMLSVIPGLLLMLLIPYIIRLYLGPQWSDAGRFCQFMIPYAVGVLISGSLAFIPNVFEKQLNSLLIYVVYLVFRIGALGLGIILKDVYLAVGLYSLVSLLAVTYQVFWYRKIILASDQKTTI